MKLKARIIANYIIRQIQKISKYDTCNDYLRIENSKTKKTIYIKFNMIDGVKDINMNFIEYCNSKRKNEYKPISYYWNNYKKRLPSKFYKYLDLLSKRYDYREPEKVRKLALMVMYKIYNSRYKLCEESFAHNTMIKTIFNSYKITLELQ